MIPPLFGKQEVDIWRVKKRFPQYGVPIWSLWPNIRFLPSIVVEKNATKNGHIQNVCSMCMKINKVGKQEVGIWWVQKRYPQYGILIWRLWPNIRFLPSTVTEKNATKNILDGRKDGQTDRGKTVCPLPFGERGILTVSFERERKCIFFDVRWKLWMITCLKLCYLIHVSYLNVLLMSNNLDSMSRCQNNFFESYYYLIVRDSH
jgi:hypothetical protein